MVLLAGLVLVFAWLCRCGLYPGSNGRSPLPGVTDDRFALAVRDPGLPTGADAVLQVFQQYRAVGVEEQEEEDRQP
jgi:hypothetical protein